MSAQFSFRTKLLVLCLILSLFGLATAMVGVRALSKVSESSQRVTLVAMPNIDKLNDMFLAYRGIRINLRSLGIPGLTEVQQRDFVAQVDRYVKGYEELATAYEASQHTSEEKQLYLGVQGAWTHFRNIVDRTLELHANGSEAALKQIYDILLSDCPKAAAEFTEAMTALKAEHLKFNETMSARAKNEASWYGWFMMVLSVGSLAGGLVVSFAFASRISNQILTTTERLASTAAQIASSSQVVSQSSLTLSSAAAQQAASLQETAASLEEITAMVEKTSHHAVNTSSTSDSSRNKAESGHQSVGRLVNSIDEIRSSNEDVLARVHKNGDQMIEIAEIMRSIDAKTKLIDDIVFQTKLLSFNASVEAARAGEHGKGFSVVAEEIGTLARTSGEAAHAIGALLQMSVTKVDAIARETRDEVSSLIERGRQRVQTGQDMAQECAEALSAIVQEVSRVAELSGEISLASREQTQGINEINKAMAQLDGVTQQNASASGEAASTAGQLNEYAQGLEECVGHLNSVLQGKRAG